MKLLRDQSAALRTRSPVAYPAGMSRGSLRRDLHFGLLAKLPERVTGFVKIVLILFAGIAVSPGPTLAHKGEAHPERTPVPNMVIENPGQCVAPPEEMRRNHMEMLKHQRDRSLRQGIRGEAASLNACINCHASKKTGSVLGKGDFCESCHAYAAVKLDCFECHQPKARFKATGLKP